MTKLAGVLVIIGLGLLLVALMPRPNSAAEQGLKSQAETAVSPNAAQGQALFLAKGCATCHRHDDAGEGTGQVAIMPDLSAYRPDPDFVGRWLADPAAVRPGTQMPDLELSDEEIAALIAFLSAGEDPCPVTRPPDRPFEPPGSPAASFEGLFWYGSDSLSTQLPLDGEWRGLPLSERGYTQKIFFSSEGYDWREEPLPALTVSGRRLDGARERFEEQEATNGFHPDVGSFMLVGVDIPAAGCWQITSLYAGHELSFVVWVAPA